MFAPLAVYGLTKWKLTLLLALSLCALSLCRFFRIVVGAAAVVLPDAYYSQERRFCDLDPRMGYAAQISIHGLQCLLDHQTILYKKI